MKNVATFLFGISVFTLSAQPTWSGEIASILYKNCTNCHNPNGIANFSMMDYSDAKPWASSMAYQVQSGLMPPWKPDTNYQRFVHERILTDNERQKIVAWAGANAPSGDLTQAPAPPFYPRGGILGTPNLKVQMPVYTSKATSSKDDYICVSIPSGLTKDRKIKAVEVIPGNRQIVHHTLVFIDPTGQYVGDTVGGDCGSPSTGNMVTGYAPGGQPTLFPNGGNFKTGMTLPAGSNVILAMHYPEGSAGQKDSTAVHFYFYDENETGVREIQTAPLLENWNFCVNANAVKTVTDWFPSSSTGIPADVSLLSIFPHCHLLGKSMESYAIGPNSDTTPLIHIPHWDFEWQDFYFFQRMQKLEKGGRLFGTATYDNRPGNPHNPFNPPQTICAGLNTTDEMFIFYFHFLLYQAGDEHINIDSLMQNPIGLDENLVASNSVVEVYPNPAKEKVTLDFSLEESAFVNLFIYDLRGNLIQKLVQKKMGRGEHSIIWDGKNEAGNPVPSGVYFYSLKMDEKLAAGQIFFE